RREYRVGAGLVILLALAVTAEGQQTPQPRTNAPEVPQPTTPGAESTPGENGANDTDQERPTATTGLEAESLPREIAEDIATPPAARRFGPTPVSEVNILMDYLRLRSVLGNSGIRSFGWVEGGYTGASPGAGLLSVQTRQNRFGDEFLLNQIGLTVQKPLQQD